MPNWEMLNLSIECLACLAGLDAAAELLEECPDDVQFCLMCV